MVVCDLHVYLRLDTRSPFDIYSSACHITMALEFGGHGLSITSEAFPPSLAVIEGGDLLNLTFYMNYNGTEGGLFENSSACQSLKNSSVIINFLITMPIVFDVVSPTNQTNHSGAIITDFSNCSFSPSLNVNSSEVTQMNVHGFNVLEFNVSSQNVSWMLALDVQLKLLHSVKADSFLNITANASFLNVFRHVNIVSYRTTIPGALQLRVNNTSSPETPGVTLTSEEEITFVASFQLPRLTTSNLKLQLMLPTFRNSTPMRFLGGSVLSLSESVESQLLREGIGPKLSVSPSTSHLFPFSQNIAEFAFGDTVNMAKESSYGNITVKVTAVVESSLGVFIPDAEGNISCFLAYDSPRGLNIKAEEVFVTLKLGQPLLEYHLNTKYAECCYEGKDMMELQFEVKNPNTATAPALNVTIDILVPSVDIEVQSFSAMLCSSTSVSSMTGNQSMVSYEEECTDLNGTSYLLTNSTSGLTIKLPRWVIKSNKKNYTMHPYSPTEGIGILQMGGFCTLPRNLRKL